MNISKSDGEHTRKQRLDKFTVQNLSYENEFDLHENEAVGRAHFQRNGFAGNGLFNLYDSKKAAELLQ